MRVQSARTDSAEPRTCPLNRSLQQTRMNGVTSRLAGAPALHRGLHRYVASGGRGGRRLWQGALRINALPTKGTLRIGTGELPLDLTSPHAELAMYCGWFEPWETQILRRLTAPAAVCVDAGASIGFHTLWLAALAGPIGAVHAFEPSPPAFERLREATAALATVRINRKPWLMKTEVRLSSSRQATRCTRRPGRSEAFPEANW